MSHLDDTAYLFTLRIPGQMKGEPMIVITAWDGPPDTYRPHSSHSPIEIQVTQGGRTIFPRGQLYGGVPAHETTDGPGAKSLALSMAEMKPGDTDADYFDGYSDEQREWASANAALNCKLVTDRIIELLGLAPERCRARLLPAYGEPAIPDAAVGNIEHWFWLSREAEDLATELAEMLEETRS